MRNKNESVVNVGVDHFLDVNTHIKENAAVNETSRQYISMVYVLSVYKNAYEEDLAKLEGLLQDTPIYWLDGMFGTNSLGEVVWLVKQWLSSKETSRGLLNGDDITPIHTWLSLVYPNTFSDDLKGYRKHLEVLSQDYSAEGQRRYLDVLKRVYLVMFGHKYLIYELKGRESSSAKQAVSELEKRLSLSETHRLINDCYEWMSSLNTDIGDGISCIEFAGSVVDKKPLDAQKEGVKVKGLGVIIEELEDIVIKAGICLFTGYLMYELSNISRGSAAPIMAEALPASEPKPPCMGAFLGGVMFYGEGDCTPPEL